MTYSEAVKCERNALSDFRDFVAERLKQYNPNVTMVEVRQAVADTLNSMVIREQISEHLEYWGDPTPTA